MPGALMARLADTAQQMADQQGPVWSAHWAAHLGFRLLHLFLLRLQLQNCIHVFLHFLNLVPEFEDDVSREKSKKDFKIKMNMV